MIRILHLYPNLMNLYGDYGNIDILVRHLNDQGIKTKVDKKEVEDSIMFANYDIVYMGPGTEANQRVALDDLYQYKEDIIDFVNAGKVLLFTGNAMELLGKKINDFEAVGLFNYETKITKHRYVGTAIVTNDTIGDLAGFINKSSLTSGDEEHKLFDYKYKDKRLVDNDYEGYRVNNAFATHLIGPIFAKNPNFTKYIVSMFTNEYKEIEYIYEQRSYDVSMKELRNK